MTLTATERKLINRIQTDLPLTSHPFKTLGDELGMEESAVLDLLIDLKKRGIIRRVGGNFVPHKVGFVSTLCAAKVPAHKVDDFAAVVNRYPGVTHNYQRENDYNVWFTFIAESREIIAANLKAITKETGIEDILNLPATDLFKINAKFKV